MSWNPNQGQDPNQQNPYGAYTPPPQGPPPQGAPYSGQQYGQPGAYQQGGYQQAPGGYQQPYGAPPTGAPSPLGPSSIGMDPKISAGLSYLFGIVGLIFFFMEKQNRFVRFHALQSILLSISAVIAYTVLFVLSIAVAVAVNSGGLATAFTCLFSLAGIALFVGWLIALIQAFSGKYFKLPLIGNLADRWSARGVTGL